MTIPKIGTNPFTLEEVRDNVADLIVAFQDEPGVELLGFVAAMLNNTRCHCQYTPSRNATVLQLPAKKPEPHLGE